MCRLLVPSRPSTPTTWCWQGPPGGAAAPPTSPAATSRQPLSGLWLPVPPSHWAPSQLDRPLIGAERHLCPSNKVNQAVSEGLKISGHYGYLTRPSSRWPFRQNTTKYSHKNVFLFVLRFLLVFRIIDNNVSAMGNIYRTQKRRRRRLFEIFYKDGDKQVNFPFS